jgi:uncharacterized protein (TIGR00269 family)
MDVVKRTIKHYKLLRRDDTVLVAVSGGKDSLALWDVLLDLGYEAEGLYIDLGIRRENYSRISRDKAEAFARRKGSRLLVLDIKREYGVTLPGAARKNPRTLCSVCGIIKRHEMSRVALDGGYDVLATGHNLDDEAGVLLGNLFRWNLELLGRQAPRLEAWHPKLKPKVKPLCLLTERETATYAVARGIDYVYELECPFSVNSPGIIMKEALNRVEERSPGTKLYFFKKFQTHRGIFIQEATEASPGECETCGFPSSSDVCAFCRIVGKRVP